MLDAAFDAPSQRAALIRSGTERIGFQTRTVVGFQHLDQALPHGMFAKVGRQVGDTQPCGVRACCRGRGHTGRRYQGSEYVFVLQKLFIASSTPSL